jgi:chromosome segregation ATPase
MFKKRGEESVSYHEEEVEVQNEPKTPPPSQARVNRSDVEDIAGYLAYLQDKVPNYLVRAMKNEEDLGNLKERHRGLERRFNDLRTKSEDAHQQLAIAVEERKSLQSMLDAERSNVAQANEELTLTRKALHDLEREFRDLKNQFDINADKKSYLEKLYEEKSERLNSLQSSYGEITARRNLLEIDVIEKTNELKSLREELVDLKQEMEEREASFAKKDEKIANLSAEVMNLKRTIVDRNDQVEKHEKDYKKLFDELHKSKSEHEVSVRGYISKMNALEQNHTFANRRYEEVRDELKQLKAAYATVLEENRYLKGKYMRDEYEAYEPPSFLKEQADAHYADASETHTALPAPDSTDNTAFEDDTIRLANVVDLSQKPRRILRDETAEDDDDRHKPSRGSM